MPEPLVITVMNRFKADLMRREAAQMRSMARRWRQTEAALLDQAELFALRVKEDGLTAAQLRDARFMLDRSQSLLRQARRELTKYVDYAGPLIETGQRQAAAGGIQSANAAINAIASESGVTIDFNRLPVAAVENMVGLAGDNSPLTTLLESSYGAGVDGMFTELIRATALGKNPRETAARMVREGYSQSLTRMMVIARTEQLRVYREAARQAYQESGVVESFRRLATRDSRVCAGCLMADGEEYELNQTLREHPQGRCTIIPTVTGFPPVQWEKGPDWFVKQSPEIQSAILGRGKYAAWKDGKFDLDQLVSVRPNATWGDSLQPTPLKSLLDGTAPRLIVKPPVAPPPIAPPIAPTLSKAKPLAKVKTPAKAPKPAPVASKVNAQTASEAREKILQIEKNNAKQIAPLEKERDSLMAKTKEVNTEKAKLAKQLPKAKGAAKSSIEARLQELTLAHEATLADVKENGKKLKAARGGVEAFNVLKVDNPSAYKMRTSSDDPEVVSNFNHGLSQFNQLVSADIKMPMKEIRFVKLAPGGRAFARAWDEEIHVVGNQETRIIVHELAHILETRAGLLDKVMAFHDKRTAGEKPESLAKLTGLNFGPTEVTRKDKYMHPYMGKDYERKATEILSMGVEYYYDEPARMAKEDPDMFDFIYDLLRGR